MNFEVFHLVMKDCVSCFILLLTQNDFTEEGEIKDAKMSSFSSNFQTLILHLLPLYFLYELLMSLRGILDRILGLRPRGKVTMLVVNKI